MKTIIFSFFLCLISCAINCQCFTDRHNTSADEAWITCDKEANPNIIRGDSHWIMYDLGSTQQLGQTHFWNINAVNQTQMGIQLAVLDYSTDGVNWLEWGSFELEEASSSGFYEGETGPDLSGTAAQYVLITVIENHGNVCSGLSEIRIESFGEVSSIDNVELTDSNVFAQPNPAIDFTVLTIVIDESQTINIGVLDLKGQKISESNHNLTPGRHNIRTPLDNLPVGQYLINVDNGREIKSLNVSIVNP